MSKRTKALDISNKVRQEVIKRDKGCCIFCGRYGNTQVCHYVSRGRGGLGIEENLALGCLQCHINLDQSKYGKEMSIYFRNYLKSKYTNWNEELLKYRR